MGSTPTRLMVVLTLTGLAVGVLTLVGCSTVQPATGQPAVSPPVPSKPKTVPPTPEPAVPDPTVPDPTVPETQSPPDAPVGTDALAAWIDRLPVKVRISDGDRDGDRQIRGEYMVEVLQLKLDGTRRRFHELDDTVAAAALVTEFKPTIRITPSSRHYYAAADMGVTVYLQGVGGQSVDTVVTGPTVFSSLSYRDAALNSLRSFDRSILERVASRLRRTVKEQAVQDGLAYSIEYASETGEKNQHGALRAFRILNDLGRPGYGETMWYIHLSPDTVQDRITKLLVGSDLVFRLNMSTRIGRFSYRDEG